MEKIMILNASPRAPRSNSKQYAGLFTRYWPGESEYFELRHDNHSALIERMEAFSDVLLVFPLYVDSLPVALLHFLKSLESHPANQKPVLSVLVNCGFFEPQQNDVAVEMMRLYCAQNGYPFGSVLKIGSGEAILTTPFRVLLYAKIKKLARSIRARRYRTLQVTMPLPKKTFLKASASYWKNCGKRNGCTKEEMQTMQIE